MAVDVVWPPAVPACGTSSRTHAFALALYSLLCRHVEPGDPDASAFDLVRRPGLGIPVALGRSLAAIAEELAAIPRGGRRVALVILDGEVLDARAEAAVRTLLDAGRAAGASALVLAVSLDARWDDALGDAGQLRLAGVAADQQLPRLRVQVLARLGSWLAGAGLTIWLRRRSGDPRGEVERGATTGEDVETRLRRALADAGVHGACVVGELAQQASRGAERVAPANGALVVVRDGAADDVEALRDLLDAKRRGWPVVTVIAGAGAGDDERTSPYGGNGASLAWSDARAGELAERCLGAWVRDLHFRLAAPAWLARAGARGPWVVASRPPELVDFTLGALPTGRDAVIVYPDPPISHDEAAVILRAEPQVRLTTPTTLFAGGIVSDDPAPPFAGRTIALSMAESPDAPALASGVGGDGCTQLHLRDAIARLTLVLVRAGARLAYGGRLEPPGLTRFLAELIERHDRLGTSAAARPLLFGHDGPPPVGLAVELRPCPSARPDITGPADEALRLSAMRACMTEACDARVALGGAIAGYQGRFPGILEECWSMLRAGKPVYMLGGYGGAARIAALALQGTLPAAWADEVEARRRTEGRAAMMDDHDADSVASGRGPGSLRQLVADLAAWGVSGRDDDARWTNGLTTAENRRLFVTRDLHELATLVLRGLSAALPAIPSGAGGPALRLLHGGLDDVERVEAYAVPVVDDLPVAGACAALDRRLGGALVRALAAGETIVPVGGARLAGRCVFVVRLGSVAEVAAAPETTIRAAATRLAAAVRDARVQHLALVPFGVSIGVSVASAVGATWDVLRAAGTLETLTFVERQAARFAELTGAVRALGLLERAVVLPPQPATTPLPSDQSPPLTVCVRHTGAAIATLGIPPIDDVAPTVHPVEHPLSDEQRAWLAALGEGRRGHLPAELHAHGRTLAALCPDVVDLVRRYHGRCLDLVLDERAAAIPWEALLFTDGDGDGERTPALDGGVRRRLAVHAPPGPPVRRIAPGERLAVLLIVDPTADVDGAQEEGETIAAVLQRHRAAVDVETLAGEAASLDAVLGHLRRRRWDVLHYAGHARHVPGHPEESGLKLAHGRLTVDAVAGAAPWPPLVIVNACQSAVIGEPSPCTVGEGVHDPALAHAILTAGVRTFIGTLWLVTRRTTSIFTAALYDRLVTGAALGDAMRAARRALGDRQAGYVLYGDIDLRF